MKVKIGNSYGKLTIISLARTEKYNSGQNKYFWTCKCECGNICEKTSQQLLQAKTPSCGCFNHNKTHGLKNTRLYRIWVGMKYRCYGKKWRNHKTYHKNKIKMCDEWRNSFIAFYDWAMSNGYQDNLSIDRINNLGNYEPSNCRWADRTTQANNTSKNVWVYYDGEKKTIAQWARFFNMSPGGIRGRLARGWGCRL